MSDELKNYYDVLEVAVNADHDSIRDAYQRAKSAYSQDSLALYSLMSPDEAKKVLDLIEEAYSILSDPEKRKKYNAARGIDTPADSPVTYKKPNDLDEFNTAKKSTGSSDMNKLVAKKRYGLEYNEDSQFEVEIEQCTEFTGEFLKKVREYKNVDIQRLSEMTKISKTFIRYIEEEDIQKMPALVYVRGFVYQYAKCLKLSPELVANSYLYRIKKLKGEL